MAVWPPRRATPSRGRQGPGDATDGSIAGRLARVHTSSEPPERAPETATSGGREAVQRWRLVVSRAALPADLVQRDQLAGWEATLVASCLPVVGLDTPRAKPRFVSAAPLAAAIAGEAELADVWLTQRLPRWRVREALADRLPTGCALVDLYDVWLGESPLPGRVVASVYRATLPAGIDVARLAAAAAALLDAPTLQRARRKGEGTVTYDLRPFLATIEVAVRAEGGAIVRLTLRHDPARGIGRPDEALAALGDALASGPLEPETLVREGIVLASPPPPEPPAPRGPRRGSPPRPGRNGPSLTPNAGSTPNAGRRGGGQ